MGVDEARHQRLAAEVDDLGRIALDPVGIGLAADQDDFPALDRQRFGAGQLVVDGDDVSADLDEIGRFSRVDRGRRRCGRGLGGGRRLLAAAGDQADAEQGGEGQAFREVHRGSPFLSGCGLESANAAGDGGLVMGLE
jgi:hypothetical protein